MFATLTPHRQPTPKNGLRHFSALPTHHPTSGRDNEMLDEKSRILVNLFQYKIKCVAHIDKRTKQINSNEMIITNEILNAVIHCRYKAYLKKISQPSTKTEFETIVERLKEKQKTTIENNHVPFKNTEVDLTLDGIYKDKKNYSVPILISPFEKVQKSNKLFISLQAYYIKQYFNLNRNHIWEATKKDKNHYRQPITIITLLYCF